MIVVTGACGFIGSRIVEGLFNRGCTDKVVLVDKITDRNVRKISKFPIYDFLSPSQFLHRARDITKESTCVFHQGAITDTTHPDVSEIMNMNHVYTKALISNCVVGKTRLVYASSAAVYGNGKNGFKEEVACEAPLNVYGFSKVLIDNWARQGNLFDNYDIFGLRYFNVYGMGEDHKENMCSPVLKFFNQAKTSNEINVFKGSRSFYRDFVAVEDIVNTNLQCAFDDVTAGIYNVGSGKKISFLKVANIVKDFFDEVLDNDVKINSIPFPDNLCNRYQKNTHANLINLRKAGYKEKMIDPEIGIKKYLLDLSQV